ncbi:MAG: hypothetical protein WCD53_04485 [Microcoleus sp.]
MRLSIFIEDLRVATHPTATSHRLQETGFLREFTHPHRDLARNPVSDSPHAIDRPKTKKPGFCENLRILTEI